MECSVLSGKVWGTTAPIHMQSICCKDKGKNCHKPLMILEPIWPLKIHLCILNPNSMGERGLCDVG